MVLRKNNKQLFSGSASSRGDLQGAAPVLPPAIAANPWALLMQLSQAMAGGCPSPAPGALAAAPAPHPVALSPSPCLALTGGSPTYNAWPGTREDSCITPPSARPGTPDAAAPSGTRRA